MIQVKRKDQKESLENLIRRFNRKAQQSGVISIAKQGQYFQKPISKKERRESAIVRAARKEEKIKKQKLS